MQFNTRWPCWRLHACAQPWQPASRQPHTLPVQPPSPDDGGQQLEIADTVSLTRSEPRIPEGANPGGVVTDRPVPLQPEAAARNLCSPTADAYGF
jgi:hypothetical protein